MAVLAQATKAGVVTTLQGTATVTRSATPEPAPLKFKDDVFLQDSITTGDSSLVRILLGGKAVITIRERSALTIHETATTATVDISRGKIAVAVAKERMKPGESVQIRTPNALAGVRGTVVIADVNRTDDRDDSVDTRFTLLTGIIDVTRLDLGRPSGPVTMLHPLQTISVIGSLPPSAVRPLGRTEAQALAKDYKVSLPAPPPPANAQVTEKQVEQAVQQAAALGGTKVVARDGEREKKDTAKDDAKGDKAGGDDADNAKISDKATAKADKADKADDKDTSGPTDKPDAGGAKSDKPDKSDKGDKPAPKGDKNGSKTVAVAAGSGAASASGPGGSGPAAGIPGAPIGGPIGGKLKKGK